MQLTYRGLSYHTQKHMSYEQDPLDSRLSHARFGTFRGHPYLIATPFEDNCSRKPSPLTQLKFRGIGYQK